MKHLKRFNESSDFSDNFKKVEDFLLKKGFIKSNVVADSILLFDHPTIDGLYVQFSSTHSQLRQQSSLNYTGCFLEMLMHDQNGNEIDHFEMSSFEDADFTNLDNTISEWEQQY